MNPQQPTKTLLPLAVALSLLAASAVPANPTLTPGTWANISPSIIGSINHNNYFAQGMAIDPSNPSTLYICVAAVNDQTWQALKGGIYKTTNGGSTWRKIGRLDKPTWNGTDTIDSPVRVRVDPMNSNHLYCADGVRGGSMGFWVSNDAGETWTSSAGFSTAAADPRVNAYSDLYSVAADPSDFNHLLLSFHSGWAGSNNCGVLESTDGGATFRIVMPDSRMNGPGYDVFFLSHPSSGTGDRNTWLVGCQGAGYFRTTNAGASWTQISSLPMPHGGAGIYYTANGTLYIGATGILRSTNNGATVQTTSAPSAWYIGITGDGTNVYAGAFNTTANIIRAPEGSGTPWTNSTSQQFKSGPFEMAFDSDNRIVYASTPGDGMLALKLGSTGAHAQPVAAMNKRARVDHVRFSSSATRVLVQGSAASGTPCLYDIAGKRLSSNP